MNLSECEKKKKRSLTAICTLGISTVPVSKLWVSSSDTEKDMSFGGTVFGFIFKLALFLLIALPWMAIAFVYHFFNYFYLDSFEKKLRSSDKATSLIQQIRFSNPNAYELAKDRLYE